jgi:hypothetical protein
LADIYPDNFEILDRDALGTHVPGHFLAFEDAPGALILPD